MAPVSQSYCARVTRQLGRIKMARGCEATYPDGRPCDYPITVPTQLAFDHRDPATKHPDFTSAAGHGTMPFVTWACAHDWHTEVIPEIDKCDVICGNCHQLRTTREGHNSASRRNGQRPTPHPTLFP